MAQVLQKYVGRLAPSPTGALHLGNVRTFMVAWLRARSQGGRLIMRMEDLDHPRDKPGAAQATLDELKWLGFDWDVEFVQSERKAKYREALEALKAQGLVYPCTCSRRDVEAAQSAPHAGEQLHYPGTCRGRHPVYVPGACWRFKVESPCLVEFDDVFAGRQRMDVAAKLGDFPLARDEFGAGYTLAAAVDDAEMGITEVVRGDDLIPATPPQILVQRALGLATPAYCHLPLLVGTDGRRLAKRHGDSRIAAYRGQGLAPEAIVGYLAWRSGLVPENAPVTLASLLPHFSLARIPLGPCVLADAGLMR